MAEGTGRRSGQQRPKDWPHTPGCAPQRSGLARLRFWAPSSTRHQPARLPAVSPRGPRLLGPHRSEAPSRCRQGTKYKSTWWAPTRACGQTCALKSQTVSVETHTSAGMDDPLPRKDILSGAGRHTPGVEAGFGADEIRGCLKYDPCPRGVNGLPRKMR